MLIDKLKLFYITLVFSTFGGGILFSVYNNKQPISEINPKNTTDDFKEKHPDETNFEILYSDYVKKHDQVVTELLNSTNGHDLSSLPKVVVVKPSMKTGYGNRFPILTCGFLYSLVTDRLFFIDGYQNFEDYFKKDFNHDWESVAKLYENSTAKYLHNGNGNNEFALITRGDLSSAEVNSSTILYVKSWDYACAPLTSNPHYQEWFEQMIPDYKVFATISSKLLRLQENIDEQAKNFVSSNFSDYNMGIHLRTKKSTKKMVIPVEHYCQAVRMILLGKKENSVSIFVAADTNQGRDNLVDCLRHFLSHNDNSVKVVYVENNMNIKNPLTHNPGNEENALVDMKLLSWCDDLVITYGSSFGFVAAGWSDREVNRPRGPFVLMPITNSTQDLTAVDKVWVWGASSNEPCMYLSKSLLRKGDAETVKTFKNNPLWMHYSQCHWPV